MQTCTGLDAVVRVARKAGGVMLLLANNFAVERSVEHRRRQGDGRAGNLLPGTIDVHGIEVRWRIPRRRQIAGRLRGAVAGR